MLSALRALSRAIPEDLAVKVMEFGETGGSGLLVISNLDLGSIPPTPQDLNDAEGSSNHCAVTVLAISRLLGHPVGYEPEFGGDLVQNVIPAKGGEYRQVSTSSKAELMFHTEAAFHPHQPRWLILLCLRGDEHAHTTYATSRDVVNVLPEATIRQLQLSEYRCGVDESYGDTKQLSERKPVIWGSKDCPRIWFDADLTVATTIAGVAALSELRDAISLVQGKVTLRSGDLLILDNTLCVHGRSSFTPRFDGTDRWLQRCFVTSDLAPSDAERQNRIITTTFNS